MKSFSSVELFDKISESFNIHHKISNEVLNTFSQELWEHPEKALDNFFKAYEESLNRAYTNESGENMRAFVESTCGGPHEAIPSAFYNVIGSVYPLLDRDVKNKALGKILAIFDYNYDYQSIQISHTPYICEPLLLSEITIARPLYWPGLDEGKFLIEKYKNLFCDFKFEAMDEKGNFNPRIVNSDFVMAYSILRKDFCNWGEEYAELANPKFLDRVIKGIVGMSFASYFKLKNLTDEEIERINYEGRCNLDKNNYYEKVRIKLEKVVDKKIFQGKNKMRDLLPSFLEKKINFYLKEKDWAEPFFSGQHKNYLLYKTLEKYVESSE